MKLNYINCDLEVFDSFNDMEASQLKNIVADIKRDISREEVALSMIGFFKFSEKKDKKQDIGALKDMLVIYEYAYAVKRHNELIDFLNYAKEPEYATERYSYLYRGEYSRREKKATKVEIKNLVNRDIYEAKQNIAELKVGKKEKAYKKVVKKHEKLGSAIIFELFGKKD